MTTIARSRPVISAWSAVSPFGIGRDQLIKGLRAGQPADDTVDSQRWKVPDERARLVPGFALREILGSKGTRSMDRVSGLAVTAVRELLAESERASTRAGESTGVGLVLGTTTGSAQSMMDFSRDSFVQAKPYFVEAARFPNAVMNCAAGQCAIWHQLKGPNATVAGGRAAGLYALNYARRLLDAGRAHTVFCGAVEEYSSARAWLEHHSRTPDEAGTVLGEGCAVLLLEPAAGVEGQGPLAEILSVEFAMAAGVSVKQALASAVRRAFRSAGVTPDDVYVVSPCAAPGDAGAQERDLVDEVFGPGPLRLDCAHLLGDTAAASAAFQVCAVLTLAEESADAQGRVAAVTSVDRTGVVGCALLRLR
ncbi:3-oxoacyl-ACP synthase [Planosporangium thailandense]|uniref:3-oxoacyl-ACP synthase n=1 Tax=Planosporangium thailandense TaxID=765197 RepID=A0ABX0XX95_9ACTN|nr:beta-ketoacyl synthase N-terminal-like domain-containing protein [Planosporangium thailandense]NJC70667.1 3-oxoacyl-ACP synthase [Planosporangium thailandense]